jgi:hypothetical protein
VSTTGNSIRELQTDNIVFVEAITLEGVDNHSCLFFCFKVCKAEMDFMTIFGFSWDETQLFEANKGPKDVSQFTLSSICRQALDIDGSGDIFGRLEDIAEFSGQYTQR